MPRFAPGAAPAPAEFAPPGGTYLMLCPPLYLRLSAWDARVLINSFPVLMKWLKDPISDTLKKELHWGIQQIWDTHYHIGGHLDLPFHLGMLLYQMGDYAEAIDYYQHSIKLHGTDPNTAYNLGLCHYYLGQMRIALQYIDQALELDSNYEAAKKMRNKVQAVIDQVNT
jgi:tetratricopeptide (TPR) repeat protein